MANQGIYHPTFNPNGSKLANDNKKWYETTVSLSSISDCFDASKALTASGYIGTTSARADGIFYDQVHESSIIDLRNSSAKVEDYNRLIDREFNKLVAGTYRGSEGEYFTKTVVGATARRPFNPISPPTYQTMTTRTKSNTITHTDIISSASVFDAAFKNGVTGVWLALAEDDTSLVPNGALTAFKLSRKANATPLQVLKSTDSGTTWTALTVTTHYTFSTTTNAITMVTAPLSTDLIMVTYQTHTNMAIVGVNSEVLAIGDVFGTLAFDNAHFVSTTIGKVSVSSAGVAKRISTRLTDTALAETAGFTNTLDSTGSIFPKHIALTSANVASPSVKVFPYLTRLNGKARLQLVFKEMKYTSTWGDDSKFNIVDNVSTTTDNNAQIVLIGQKYCELPYFILAGE